MGCILGEVLNMEPLLPGDDYFHQLMLIVKLLGTPSKDDLWYVSNPNARKFMADLPETAGKDFGEKFPSASPNSRDLLRGLLTIDPAKRISVAEAINHPFLEPVRIPEVNEKEADFRINIEDIEALELTKATLRRKMFEEIRLFHEGEVPGSSGGETAMEGAQAEPTRRSQSNDVD